MCTIVLFLFYLIVLTGVKCWTPDWPRWIFVKISERKAHVLWGRFTAIITKRSPLHLPHANWWQANQQHAPKTTVPLCWHSFCSLAFFSLSSLCLSAFFSPSLWPHLSLFLFHLVVFCIFITFFFFAPELFFSPPTLVSTPPLSVLSLLSAPAAMWSRRGSRVTEAGPFGVASSLSRLRGAAVHVHWVFVCVWAGRCSRGQSEVWEDDALDTLWGEEEEVREKSGGRDF